MKWKFWESLGDSAVDPERVDRDIAMAKEKAKESDEHADEVTSELRRHRQENHFSELVDYVLRGGDK